IGLALGDFSSGFLSQAIGSRKKVVGIFLGMTAVFIVAYFTVAHQSLPVFYVMCAALGFSTGYWAVFVTMASEQFGTSIRAAMTTTAPNFVRGAVVPLTSTFQTLGASFGLQAGAIIVAAATVLLALAGLRGLAETYGKDLGFLEEL